MVKIKLVHKTRLVSPKALMANPKNAVIHPDSQIEGLAESFRKFGFIGAVLVGDDDTIVAGHGRVLAAELAGMEKIPAIDVTHLSPEAQDALMMVDNKSGEAKRWDEEMLNTQMKALENFEFDFSLFGLADQVLEEYASYPGEPEHSERKGVPPDGADFDTDENEDGTTFEEEQNKTALNADDIRGLDQFSLKGLIDKMACPQCGAKLLDSLAKLKP